MPALKNARHEKFAQFVAKGESQRQAYILCGYKKMGAEPHSSRLASNGKVKARIDEIKASIAEGAAFRAEISKEWVLRNLRENAERAMQAMPVYDREGNATGEYRYEGTVANRALELIGKELGMFRDRVEANLTVDVPSLNVIVQPSTPSKTE
jgi:phage terminase small subunit